jgi:hypothetical protein
VQSVIPTVYNVMDHQIHNANNVNLNIFCLTIQYVKTHALQGLGITEIYLNAVNVMKLAMSALVGE